MSTLFSGHYLRNRSTFYIGVLGYIGIVQHKEHSPEVLSIPPGTPCIINQQDATLAVLCLLTTTYGHLQRVTIPDAVIIQFDLLRMSKVLLETC